MRAGCCVTVSCLAVLSVLCTVRGTHAQQFMPAGRDTLRGLPGVEVVVEPIDPAIAPLGLTAPAIAAGATRQLAAAGITVYPSQAQNPSAAKAYLYVQVGGAALQRQGHVVGIQVQVRQTLRSVVTSSNIVNAMTWDQGTVLFVPTGSGTQLLQGEVQSLVAQFVKDWRAVH